MSQIRRATLLVAVLANCVALAACGASGSSDNTPVKTVGTTHAVVGFAAHAGLAFGAFKLFVYNPYKQGKLSFHHPLTLAKAGAAALFAYHEVKKALAELQGHPKLQKLVAPLTALGSALTLLKSHLAHGDSSSVSSVQSSIGSLTSQSSALGSPIQTLTSGIHL